MFKGALNLASKFYIIKEFNNEYNNSPHILNSQILFQINVLVFLYESAKGKPRRRHINMKFTDCFLHITNKPAIYV